MWFPPPSVTRAPRGLVLSKLCQPCNDPQQSAVSLLIRRPSPWPPPLPAFGIPPPHHLFDPPFPHVPPPPSDPPYVRPSSWVLLSVPSASAAGWCLLLWRQPIRGLTSSVSKIWLTGQPQRLRLLSEEEGEDGGGCLPSLSGCSFPSPWRWLGTASCFRPLKLWCGILSIWEPLCWFTARSAGTKDQTVTDINYLGQRRLREARKFQACWPLL